MKIKYLIKRLMPAVLLDFYRSVPRKVWRGSYRNFSEIPKSALGTRSDNWADAGLNTAQDASAQGGLLDLHPMHFGQDLLLPFLGAVRCHQNGGKLTVLDFGGGAGIGYIRLLPNLVGSFQLDYHIVDLDWASKRGPSLFGTDTRIHFHRSLPNNLPGLDIIHINNVLQLIEDYAGLLAKLWAYDAPYVLLGELYVGNFSTFASVLKDNFSTFASLLNDDSEVVCPYWFFNLDEVINLFDRAGYNLVFKQRLREFTSKKYPVDGAFPCTLLFARR